MNIQIIEIPSISLEWTNWINWNKFLLDGRYDPESVNPPQKSGVYEARLIESEERLTIGKASNLRNRVKQGLVKGSIPHSAGNDI